jgi:hypothetical protein
MGVFNVSANGDIALQKVTPQTTVISTFSASTNFLKAEMAAFGSVATSSKRKLVFVDSSGRSRRAKSTQLCIAKPKSAVGPDRGTTKPMRKGLLGSSAIVRAVVKITEAAMSAAAHRLEIILTTAIALNLCMIS